MNYCLVKVIVIQLINQSATKQCFVAQALMYKKGI